MAGVLSETSCGMVKEKVEPSPYTLSTDSVPFIRLTRWRVMARPSPVPSTFLFRVLSTWEKESKILFRSFSLIPIPVSETEIFRMLRISLSTSFTTEMRMVPSLVNFTALFARLIRICRIRRLSPNNCAGRLGSMSKSRVTSLSTSRVMMMFDTSLNRDMVSYWIGVIFSFPDSILEKSRMSLMMERSARPEDLICWM